MQRLLNIYRKETRKAVGLMSGTSVDGIDTALVEITGTGLKAKIGLLAFETFPFPPTVRDRIFRLFDPRTSTVADICHMNFLLGELFADACLSLLNTAGVSPSEVDLIGSHGQTIYHLPNATLDHGFSVRSTLQIGEGAIIAEKTGIVTISDFRVRDMAAGGQGAPLVPYVDYILFHHPNKTRIIQNIGGIGNLTVVSPAAGLDGILAFDTGPGNMLIDGLITNLTQGQLSYDPNGSIAAKGHVSDSLLEELMHHPYLRRTPPKTTGREEFGLQFAEELLTRSQPMGLSKEDLVATATAFTARTITQHYQDYVIPEFGLDEVVIGGGGSHNLTLLRMIQENLPDIPVYTHEHFGLSSDAKEALAFALLANECLNGETNNVPSATGATKPVVMGKISQ